MLRRLLFALLLGSLLGCAKPDLPDTPVRASSTADLSAFRTELGGRFTADQLARFDAALKEIQLDAMNRGVATAAERESAMRAAIDGRPVRAAEILGWQARRTRLLGEIKLMADMLERDLKIRDQTAATGTPAAVINRIQNEQDILTRLRRDLAETEQQLADWGAPVKVP